MATIGVNSFFKSEEADGGRTERKEREEEGIRLRTMRRNSNILRKTAKAFQLIYTGMHFAGISGIETQSLSLLNTQTSVDPFGPGL